VQGGSEWRKKTNRTAKGQKASSRKLPSIIDAKVHIKVKKKELKEKKHSGGSNGIKMSCEGVRSRKNTFDHQTKEETTWEKKRGRVGKRARLADEAGR